MLVVWLVISAAACGKNEEQLQEKAEDSAVELRVMTFNIEWGGTHISFDNIVEAIRRADADIVGVQEAEGNLKRLAVQLGWSYNLQNYVISRFPVISPPGADGRFVYVELKPGKVVAVANVHLPSDPYGPDALRDGATVTDVLELERTARLPNIKPYLEVLAPLVDSDFPLFFTGDFNAPAHTDLVSNGIGGQPSSPYDIEWPVSRAMAAAGYQDSWRSVYPDSAANPGLTWWAARPRLEIYQPGENDPQDRIDFVWFSGTVVVEASEIVGEKGGPEVSVSVEPWPSDHRGIVSQFSVVPATMPALVSTDRRVYVAGEDVHVHFQVSSRENTLSLVDVGGDVELVKMQTVGDRGHEVFPAEKFKPGHYRVILEEEGRTVLNNEFWVLSADAVPTVRIAKGRYGKGEPIEIEWGDAPGNRNDYVAVYSSGTGPGYGNELAWTYLGALPAGKVKLDGFTAEQGWPLDPGRYLIRMMKDDGYEQLAESSSFVIE